MTAPGGILCVVDGGASGTRVRLHAPGGTMLASAEGGPSSLTLGVEGAWAAISAAIARAADEAGAGAPGGPGWRVVAALAGSRSPERRGPFLASSPLGCELRLISDGYASLLGALDGAPGTVVAVGTGVAARRLHPDGRVAAISGWGFPAADEGSGAWIGLRAVQAHLRHRDGRAVEPSALFPEIAHRLGRGREAILTWLLAADPTAYAALAPLVVAAAEGGDPLGARIVDEAAREIDATIEALDRADPDARGPVALLGGLAPMLSGRLAAPLRARLVAPRGNALDGALRVLTGRSPLEAAA